MKNKVCGIYLIIRKGTADFYVGSSVDVERRLRQHRSKLRLGKHPNTHLQNAFNLYGEEAFTFELFEEFPEDQVRHFEQVALNYLGHLPTCYNINLDAFAPMTGRKHTQEAKDKIGEALLGHTNNKGRFPSPETKAKISSGLKGRKRPPFSAETRAKMSEAGKRQHARKRLERKDV